MQQQDLIALLAELKSSLSSTSETENTPVLLQKISPALVSNFQQNIGKQATDAAPGAAVPPSSLPVATPLLTQTPDVFMALKSGALPGKTAQIKMAGGAGILNTIDPENISPVHQEWYQHLSFDEFISVYLATDTATPVLLLPVSVSLFGFHLPGQDTKLQITQGSVWILSQLLCSTAPANTYTGLTVSGGEISFNQSIPLTNKSITMPAGSACTVELNLVQPVDNTVSPDNIGSDAMNAQIQLPTTFSFNFSGPSATITAVEDASWNLYGSPNTFQYDPTQTAVYNAPLNSIFIGCKATAPIFSVSKSTSPFFTIEGTAPITEAYWELPVATIDITKTNTATGAGALAVICTPGLLVSWYNLEGGFVGLRLPLISATVGIIGITDLFAGNLYASQQFDLWANETTGFSSTLNLTYAELFTVYYICLQSGEELLAVDAEFNAQIDRPLRVDGSPVAVQGTGGLLYQMYTPTEKYFFLFDLNLIAENYTPPGGGPVTNVPQEAMALTNALLTVTPVTGIMLYGLLDTPDTFKKARMILLFGLYYLVPSLPDPYASTFALADPGRIYNRGLIDGNVPGLPLTAVQDLLFAMVNWPVFNATPGAPQKPVVSSAIFPLPGNAGVIFAGNSDNTATDGQSSIASDPLLGTSDTQNAWDKRTAAFSVYDLAMLDVSTNADLMGVSFSTMNIRAESDGDVYSVIPVNNAGETDFLQVLGMDLAVQGKFIRAFTVPEITWEPTINLTPPALKVGDQDPPLGWLLFGDDGGPSQLFNNSPVFVPIAPIPVSNFIVNTQQEEAQQGGPLVTTSIFTLPFGMRAMALLADVGKNPAGYVAPSLAINPQAFDLTPTDVINPVTNIVTGGLQITATGQQLTVPNSSASFPGFTIQLRNLLNATGAPTATSILGPSVDTIFNDQFNPPLVHQVGVPLERIDFSGYGASIFSNWQDPNASIAATSQAKFDVFVGRTSLEIIQVKSLIYPWGIRVVRTITMYRVGSAMIYRVDSGWRAETDGVYDFSYKDATPPPNANTIGNPYTFYPGVVKGVFNVTNIIENDLPVFEVEWFRKAGTQYIDPETQIMTTVPAGGVAEKVELVPVYFDADVLIDNVVQGAFNGKVPSKQMVGYVQLSPRGEPISPELFSQLLASQAGSLGGPVDCLVNVGLSGQQMRLSRVDVSNSVDETGTTPVFTGTARGTVILPKEGSWAIVQHSQATDVVSAITNNEPIPLIRAGVLNADGTSNYPHEQLRLANPGDLLQPPNSDTINYGLLQNTGSQKTLFQLPAYVEGTKQLLSKDNNFPLAKFADTYHLAGSVGIFPNPSSVPDIDMSNFSMNLIPQGYKLINNLSPGSLLTQPLTPLKYYFVNAPGVKLYIIYNTTDGSGTAQNLTYDLDSEAQAWQSSNNNITLNVDLGPFSPLVFISGNFNSQNSVDSSFQQPQLQFGKGLQPIVEILQILTELTGSSFNTPMTFAMGNGGDNYQYKFHADKEIPTVQFPSEAADGPTTPLRLSADLKVGAYFNEAMAISSNPSSLIPSAGAYFQFDGSIQVLCLSVAVGSVYAVGQVTVKISADTVTGPALYMKFGFGVELMVGLPVIGNVSVTLMAGIAMNLTSTELQITAFILFKGEVDLLGGIVDITIMIEASGTISRTTTLPESTNMTAQMTFALDISIFLVINISFSTSWTETKQIA